MSNKNHYRIHNSLDCIVGDEDATDCDQALVQYAVRVDVPLTRLKEIGYYAEQYFGYIEGVGCI